MNGKINVYTHELSISITDLLSSYHASFLDITDLNLFIFITIKTQF